MNDSFVYVVFTLTGEMLEMGSVSAAIALIREKYPDVHFGRWKQVWRARSMPAWPRAAAELRFEFGETQERNRPVAYVRVQDWAVRFDFATTD